jgi:hypothetical protein
MNDWTDIATRILAAVGIVWGVYHQFLNKNRVAGKRAIKGLTEFINAVDEGIIVSPPAKVLANKYRDVAKKVIIEK